MLRHETEAHGMNAGPRMTDRRHRSGWAVLVVAVAAIATVMTVTAVGVAGGGFTGMMGGVGAGSLMGGSAGSAGSMMGWAPSRAALGPVSAPGPGEAGFVAGTPSAPRVVRVIAGPGYAFRPRSITVRAGESITFVVTTMGPAAHEFMVGPADAVAGDTAGTAEIADIAMMRTKSLTYTFDGPGPFAFACHEAGHYEAGMRGEIAVVP